MRELELTEEWGFLEVMGHRRVPGRLTTVHLGGVSMVQVDVPKDAETFRRQFYGAASIYCLTPASEEEVRKYLQPTPELEGPDDVGDDEDLDTEEPF